MSYVVFRENGNGTVGRLGTYRSERGAKISLAAAQERENARWGDRAAQYQITDVENYNATVNGKIMVRNLMSGAMVEEDADTPYFAVLAAKAIGRCDQRFI